MRVSTSQIFDSGTLGIQRNQGSLFKTQNQLSTGRRVISPEDDPVAAAQALVTSQAKQVNSQYLENQGLARSQLTHVEGTLGSVANELQSMLEKVVQAGNGSLSSEQRGMIAKELNSRLDSIVSLANSQDENGMFIFSGFQGQTQPFQVSGNVGPNFHQTDFAVPPASPTSNPYMNYKGDSGQRKLQVSPSLEMATSETGVEAFMNIRDGQGNLTGRSMFDSIKNMIDILDPNSGIPFNQATYKQGLNDISAAVANVSRVRTSVGSRLATLDSLESASQDIDLQYEQRMSNLQDLDYASAISTLNRQQMQLEAAQKSFSQTSRLTLFDVL